MKQKEHIIKEYEDKKVVDIFDSERSKYAYQRFKNKTESNILMRNILSFNKADLKVLDVGCGTGRMLETVFNSKKYGKDIEYHGLDSSREMLKVIKKEWNNVTLKKGDAEKLPYEDNTFDLVFTFHLLWHLPNKLQLKIIKEMKRVCKKGGLILFDVINKDLVVGQPTPGIYKWKNVKRFKNSHIDKLNDFPIKNSFVYGIFNIMNYLSVFLPINLFHMIYITCRK
jgi:ubiquinone/menaquinone biosynthesis C-methylase UbiE